MWTWIWAGIAVLLFFALGRAKMKWREEDRALQSCIMFLLLDDEVRADRQMKLRTWVRDFQATDAPASAAEAHIAIGNWVANWASGGHLSSGAHTKLWQVKNGEA